MKAHRLVVWPFGMPMRFTTLLLLLMVTAACQVTMYPDHVDHGPICFEHPYAEAIGLSVGGRGMVIWQNGLDVYDAPHGQGLHEPHGESVAHLEAGEQFVILDGPGCWYVPPTSNNRIDRRAWRIRATAQSTTTGWVQEYDQNLAYGTFYFVEPLADGQIIPMASQPLKEPVTLIGHLQWTSIEGPLEPRYKTHTLTFDDYGFVQVAVKTDDPGLVNSDVFADEAACRVIVLVTSIIPNVEIVGSRMRSDARELKRWWVRPQHYDFEVSLRFIPGAVAGAAPECPDTDYSLTITPV